MWIELFLSLKVTKEQGIRDQENGLLTSKSINTPEKKETRSLEPLTFHSLNFKLQPK